MRVPASDHSTGIVLSGKRALRLKDAAPREVGIDLRRVCLATFPQAPLRSRTASFPRSGSDLGISLRRLPVGPRNVTADSDHAPCSTVCAETRPPLRIRLLLTLCPGPIRDRQVPRVPSPASGVTFGREVFTPPRWALPHRHRYYALMRQSRPLPPPRFVSLVRTVFAGCSQPLLGTAPSRRYLCESFPGCLDPYPGGPHGACARYFP